MFKLFKRKPEKTVSLPWTRSWSEAGVQVSREATSEGEVLSESLLDGFLTQLFDDGHATELPNGYLISWDEVFAAVDSPAYKSLPELLALPPQTARRQSLRSSNSLIDKDFSIVLSGWVGDDGAVLAHDFTGPVLKAPNGLELMRPAQWQLLKEVISFYRRADDDRTELNHRQAWGRLRKLATNAGACLDDFLYRSVVLTPERLEIGLRKSEHVSDDRVVEIEPGFEGAPEGWLKAFDAGSVVRDRYDIVTPDGLVQVLVTPKVRTVLDEIKRLPGRRVAGSRAQAFLLNPYATLGADATDVIVEAQFENARALAGLSYERFLPVFERETAGYPLKVGLLIETADTSGPTSSETQWLDDAMLETFIKQLRTALNREFQLVAWKGYDFEIQGDTPLHLVELEKALTARRQAPTLVSYAQVHDLSLYSSRIESIGVEKPYYSPYIAKRKEDESWFPENILPVVVYQPDDESAPRAIPTSQAAIEKLSQAVDAARQAGQDTVKVDWLPEPITLQEAAGIAATFEDVFRDAAAGNFDPAKHKTAQQKRQGTTKSLILRANIQSLDYEEHRREALTNFSQVPQVPSALRPEYPLLPHQQEGLAWMQHLYGLQAEHQVRGAVLADDMGLGKTLQLLALMAWLVERDPEIEPMLVVAPVSLLENWEEEAKKFFLPGALPMLTAYGDGLKHLRVPKSQIDQRLLAEDGLYKFLRQGWVGSAKVVLTTYETLRDLEFSFAAQRWSMMVCDEAQRIKNPAAMVTRAAKKQNVGFKIACTGTPVENTLADMWCLFDYVQPGLLGALDDFGRRYRKPIEAKTDEERARVEELRARIEPQILRRMKADVAKDLPRKIVVDTCRRLPISVLQRNLYAKAVDSFKKRNDPAHATPFKNHLGLLHYLRLICTDPRPHGLNVFKPEAIGLYRRNAPKLDWLLTQLKAVRSSNEKVIVFCEFREIQRLLQHYIEEEFGVKADIINGDTSASASHTASRQKRIKAFQALPGFGVIILSPVAVGFGVNIQAANHVVHYTRTWNPAKEDQATDRAYRIGQKKDVYVYYPVVWAEDFTTFDIKLDQLLEYKRGLADDMLNGSGDVGPGDFNIGDVVPAAEEAEIDEIVSLDMALRMSWQHFECLAAVLWTKQGYACYRTPGSSDNGVDVVALGHGEGKLIQAKSSGQHGAALGWEAVKDVVTGEAFYKKRHPNIAFDKVCITNQYFNGQAKENARLNFVALVDQTDLEQLIRKCAINPS